MSMALKVAALGAYYHFGMIDLFGAVITIPSRFWRSPSAT